MPHTKSALCLTGLIYHAHKQRNEHWCINLYATRRLGSLSEKDLCADVSKILATESVHYHTGGHYHTSGSIKQLSTTAPHWFRRWEFTKAEKFPSHVHIQWTLSDLSSCLRLKSSTIYSAPPTTCLSCSLLFVYFQLHSLIRGLEQTLKDMCWLLSAHIQTRTSSSFDSDSLFLNFFIFGIKLVFYQFSLFTCVWISLQKPWLHELTWWRFRISFKRLLFSVFSSSVSLFSPSLMRLVLHLISCDGFRRACWEVS